MLKPHNESLENGTIKEIYDPILVSLALFHNHLYLLSVLIVFTSIRPLKVAGRLANSHLEGQNLRSCQTISGR